MMMETIFFIRMLLVYGISEEKGVGPLHEQKNTLNIRSQLSSGDVPPMSQGADRDYVPNINTDCWPANSLVAFESAGLSSVETPRRD